MSAPTASTGTTLCTSFNQDSSHFAVGLRTGFRIYTTDPLRERMRRDFPDGGIGIVEMVERTNWIALVGGGREPKFPQNKVLRSFFLSLSCPLPPGRCCRCSTLLHRVPGLTGRGRLSCGMTSSRDRRLKSSSRVRSWLFDYDGTCKCLASFWC